MRRNYQSSRLTNIKRTNDNSERIFMKSNKNVTVFCEYVYVYFKRFLSDLNSSFKDKKDFFSHL